MEDSKCLFVYKCVRVRYRFNFVMMISHYLSVRVAGRYLILKHHTSHELLDWLSLNQIQPIIRKHQSQTWKHSPVFLLSWSNFSSSLFDDDSSNGTEGWERLLLDARNNKKVTKIIRKDKICENAISI